MSSHLSSSEKQELSCIDIFLKTWRESSDQHRSLETSRSCSCRSFGWSNKPCAHSLRS
ncbi:MAG: SWIM zinc finger family protein [Fimbriimonas sp.]